MQETKINFGLIAVCSRCIVQWWYAALLCNVFNWLEFQTDEFLKIETKFRVCYVSVHNLSVCVFKSYEKLVSTTRKTPQKDTAQNGIFLQLLQPN